MIHDSPVAVVQDTRQAALTAALTWYLRHQGEVEQQAGQGDGVARAVLESFRPAGRYTESAVDAFITEVEKYQRFRAERPIVKNS